MTNIYILKLVGGRYYVGKTEQVMKRYGEHLNGSGSAYTRKYKPIAIHKTIENASPFDEDRYVKEYMAKYGIEKVRGGSYVEINLSKLQTDALKIEIRNATNVCMKCGKSGHFVKECFMESSNSMADQLKSRSLQMKVKRNPSMYVQTTYVQCVAPESYFSNDMYHSSLEKCYRCGRSGHYIADCYAKTHV